MPRRSKMMTASLFAVSLAALPLGCGGNDGGGGNPTCDALKSYTASSGTLVSYENDIYPILSSTDINMGGCGQVTICHGNPPSGIDKLTNPTKTLQFLFDPPNPAQARMNLLMASVNAPGMQRVTPGSVGQSFLAYKISDRNTLACVSAMCVSATHEDPRLDRPGRRQLAARSAKRGPRARRASAARAAQRAAVPAGQNRIEAHPVHAAAALRVVDGIAGGIGDQYLARKQ